MGEHPCHDFGWWHWFDNVWLFVGPTTKTCVQIRDDLGGLTANERRFVVLEVTPKGWANRGPQKGERNISRWFKSVWRS